MTITIEDVRKKYAKEYWDLSDEQVQQVINFFYTFGYTMVDHLTNLPKAKLTEDTNKKEI